MNTPLFPHQKLAAERIAKGVPTYLGFDMGIGKTRTFIEAVKLRGAKRILVICPASAVLVWRREIRLWDPSADSMVVKHPGHFARNEKYFIVSVGLLSQRHGDVAGALLTTRAFDMTALDEAQAFNASDSLRVKVLQHSMFNLGKVTPLSGTPMKNHNGDLYTLTALCYPEGLKRKNGTVITRLAFEEMFCVVNSRYFGGSRPIRVIEGSKNTAALREILAPFMVRVRRDDVLKDLPPINWENTPIPLDTSVMPLADLEKLAALVTDAFNESGGSGTHDDFLRALQGSGARGVGIATLRRLLGLAKLRGATEYIVDLLDQLPDDRKVIVFAHHADVIASLQRHLAEYSPALLTGQSTAKEREAAVDKFLTDRTCRVFIGNIQAAGTAITLVGPKCKCSDVVFVESSWTPMDNAQAACRVHRIGQHDGVVVRMLSAAGTVDDTINAVVLRKARDFANLFDSNPAKGETK